MSPGGVDAPGSGSALGAFLRQALIWFVPALLVLPLYLLLMTLSILGGDGELLRITEGVRGGINAALGPLLSLLGLLVGGLALIYGDGVEAYGMGLALSAGGLIFGTSLAQQALRRIRERGRSS
ncbi:MAG: hypothetical protein OEY14_01735 [Myxococcales bacterium]|nr:hypothetical protein [Myxococcales bacterium]